MREIIYRCWDKKSKKYRNVDSIVFNGNSTIHGDNLPNVVNSWGEDIIAQKDVLIHREKGEYELESYTGLKDKNGDRIFEGDRLKAYLHNETEFINDVTFRDGCFHFGNFNWIEFLNKFRNIEIIGNIHEGNKGE